MEQASSVRRSTRYTTNEMASLQVIGQQGIEHCQVVNMSVTGACLDSGKFPLSLKENDIMILNIQLSEVNRLYTISAEVVWKRGTRLGVQFIDPDARREKILQFHRKNRLS